MPEEEIIGDNTDAQHQILAQKQTTDEVKNLNDTVESVLLKTDEVAKSTKEIAENTKKKDVQKVSIEGAEIITIKGEKGDKGDKGDEPADGRLQELIKPLIPAPIKGEDGKTPTKEEVLGLIEPLIPAPIKGDRGDDGISPDETTIVQKVMSLIVMPKDGKNGKNGSPDSAERVKEKLLEIGLSYEELTGLPDIEKMIRVYAAKASKTVSLEELDDVDTSVLHKTDNKYLLQDQIVVSDTPPSNPYLNQLWYDIS